jgi:hypothetical protein
MLMLANSSVKAASTTLKDKFPIKSLPGIWPRNFLEKPSENGKVPEFLNPERRVYLGCCSRSVNDWHEKSDELIL